MLPYLLERARTARLPLPLNRDPQRQPAHRPERSYFSYGQVIYRGRQVHLFGRWHIDRGNAMLWDDYDLQGVLEVARVTGLPVQTAASRRVRASLPYNPPPCATNLVLA
jgi:DNA polymerase-2